VGSSPTPTQSSEMVRITPIHRPKAASRANETLRQ
jgi:hypothetical protein